MQQLKMAYFIVENTHMLWRRISRLKTNSDFDETKVIDLESKEGYKQLEKFINYYKL